MDESIKLPVHVPTKEKYITIKMSAEDASLLLMDDLEGWEVLEDVIDGQSRWETQHRVIVQNFIEDRIYQLKYSRGSTEYQDNGMFSDCDEVKLIEMDAFEVTKIEYKPKKRVEVND